MNHSPAEPIPNPRQEIIDAVSDRFEKDLYAGHDPKIEAFLPEVSAELQPALLEELLKVEIEIRHHAGQVLGEADYLSRFPAHGQLIRNVLAEIAARPKPPVQVSGVKPGGNVSRGEEQTMAPGQNAPLDSLSFLLPSGKPGSLGRLGHYEVQEVLGQGAFGIVLKAFDEKLHRMVAIKVLSPEIAVTSPPRKRFLREARAAAAIRHENVVAIYAVEEQPVPYLVMEYIPGMTLEQALNDDAPLPVADVLRIGQQIASGLAAAHAQGLIHRDIKPTNILLENGLTGRVKITDFGLARTADDASQTQSGTIAGTPMYMSPEQATTGQIDPRSDLFSLGSVLYRMTSGRPPFRAANMLAVLKRVVDDTPRPIREIIADAPAWLCALIEKLQAKQPGDRFATAGEVSDLLGRCLADLQNNRPVQLPAEILVEAKTTLTTSQPKPAVGDGGTATNSVPAMPSPGFASSPLAPAPSRPRTFSRRAWPTAAIALLLFVGLGVTEATGVTQFASTVIRMTTNHGILVIECDDPDVRFNIDGDEARIEGAGFKTFSFKPGQYKVAATKNGKPVTQELVTITRGGKQVVRVTLEGTTLAQHSSGSQPSPLNPQPSHDPERAAAEWVLSVGGIVLLTIPPPAPGRFYDQTTPLPKEPFRVLQVILFRAKNVENEDLQRLTGLQELAHLDLTALPNVTRPAIEQLAAVLPRCRILWDGGVMEPTMTEDPDRRAAEWVLSIGGKIHVRYPDQKNAVFIEALPDQPFFVNSINLTGNTKVQPADLVKLRGLKELAGLNLSDIPLEADSLKLLGDLSTLTSCSLINTGIGDESLACLSAAKGLDYLNLQSCSITNAGLEFLPRSSGYTYLILSYCRIGGTGLKGLAGVPIRNLLLPDTDIVYSDLPGLAQDFPEVGSLDLRGLHGERGLGLEPLIEMKSLSGLTLDADAVIADAEHLAKIPALRAIFIYRKATITREFPAAFAKIPQVASLAFNSVDFESGVLEDLAQNARLDFVAISNCSRLDDNGLETLTHLAKLRTLMLSGTGVTDAGVDAFRKSRPDVKLTVDGKVYEAKAVSAWHGWPADAPKPAIAPFDAEQAKKHQEAWAAYLKVPVEYTNSLGMKFRLIPPGEFLMGSTPEEMKDVLQEHADRPTFHEIFKSAGPQHRVVLTQPYYLGLHEVTQKQYQQIVGRNPSSFASAGKNREQVAGLNTDDFPVEQVSWNDAAKFCARLSELEQLKPLDAQQLDQSLPPNRTGYRLPTEAEWEAACRAGTTMLFWTGDEPADLLQSDWVEANADQRTHAVGELRANPYGLFDLHGNVEELVQDWWHPTWYAQFEANPAVDPTGPATPGKSRVMRGGRYAQRQSGCRSSKRGVARPDGGAPYVGFRVALSVDAVMRGIPVTLLGADPDRAVDK